jgi:hypothetical protein
MAKITLNPGAGGPDIATEQNAASEHIQLVKSYASPTPDTPHTQFLDSNGDESGIKEWTGDYSSVSDIAYIQPSAGEVIWLTRMIVFVKDTGTLDPDSYGNASALTNGLVVRLQDDSGTIATLSGGFTIKTNAEWGALCYDVTNHAWGTGDETLLVRWTFAKSGVEIRLDGDSNERLEILLNDDFSGLNAHRFCVQGHKEL